MGWTLVTLFYLIKSELCAFHVTESWPFFIHCVFHIFRGCCSRICSGRGLAAWICKMGICMLPPLLRYFGAGGERLKLCSSQMLEPCHWGGVLLRCCYFGYNYHDAVLHLLLVSTGVSAAIRISAAPSFLTVSTFVVAVVFMGSQLWEVIWEKPYLSFFGWVNLHIYQFSVLAGCMVAGVGTSKVVGTQRAGEGSEWNHLFQW